MVAITHAPLEDAVKHYEELVDALERYQSFLQQRLERYRHEGRDPRTYERVVTNKMSRVAELQELLNGETQDLLRWVVDGIGTLESVDEGRWV